jgi:molecular chaperone GrpE
MTTGKRQIPINDHAPEGGAQRPEHGHGAAGHGATPRAGAPGKAAPGAEAAATRDKLAAEHAALNAERDKLAAERDALSAERDRLAAEREALNAERDSLNDQLLRLRAEFENFRKRASRESVDSYVRVQCEVLNDFLPVLDNLERALDAAEHHEEGKVLAGVRLTRDMFADLLTRSGVEEIDGVGTPFDPQVHDAIAVQPSAQDEGLVAAVLERGYRQGDRILRPARVVVSAGRAGDAGGGGTPAAGGATTTG